MDKKGIAKNLFKGDVSVWIIFMLLCCFSIIEVFSATSTLVYRQANIWIPIVRHTSFLLVGLLFILGLVHTHYKYFSLGVLLMPVSVIMLFLTLIWGINQNEASRRIELFGTPVQPSEIGKLACIIFVAFLLSKREKFSDDKTYKYILIGVGAVCLLIFPANLSTAFILGFVCFLMMFIGQIPLKKLGRLLFNLFIAGLLFVLLLIAIPENTVKSYLPRAITWKNRVDKFINFKKADQNTPGASTLQTTSDDYQVIHSKIAIARGGVIGVGPGQSMQRDFLPQAYDDFIYAIIIEESGVVGGIAVILLYLMLTYRAGIIARRCDRLFPKYLVLGCSLLILIQALFHISVVVNLIPVTGQPLPLISRGGTSIVVTCIYIGMILSVSRHNEAGEAGEAEETGEAGEAGEVGETGEIGETGETGGSRLRGNDGKIVEVIDTDK
jgi:cell division protein FtsW